MLAYPSSFCSTFGCIPLSIAPVSYTHLDVYKRQALLASVGTSRNAKRTTIIHLMFNVFGTVLFTIICMTTPLLSLIHI